VQASWRRRRTVKADDIREKCCEVAGDPEAHGFARNWDNAAVLVINAVHLEEVAEELPTARRAVTYITPDDRVHVGVLPESVHFGRVDIGMAAVAMRLSQDDLVAVPGLWLPEERRLWVPPEPCWVMERRMPNEEVARQYPQVPLT
jgi:hypothetical protein